jgi:RHS repeat-associated protein
MPPGNFTDPHNHYTFTGQELDENMGLYEFYARAYDYETGTWVQQDVYRGGVFQPKSLQTLSHNCQDARTAEEFAAVYTELVDWQLRLG